MQGLRVNVSMSKLPAEARRKYAAQLREVEAQIDRMRVREFRHDGCCRVELERCRRMRADLRRALMLWEG